jgi:hypothetical protein
MSPDIHQPRLIEPSDAEFAEYRSISGWAVAGLIIGLLSPLALADPLLWATPVIAGIVCIQAFRHIRQNAPAMIGRKAAWAGLCLAALSLSATTSDWFYYRWRISDEARQVAMYWFELLAKNRPEFAFQLTLSPKESHPLDERIWDFYVDDQKLQWSTALKKYVAPGKPGESPNLVRTLLALGDSTHVRYLKTLNQLDDGSQMAIDQLYAVTFEDSGEKKTFFVTIRLTRYCMSNGRASWQMIETQGGVDANGKKPS